MHALPYFLSYRRATDRLNAVALYASIENSLGLGSVFLDTGDDVIPAGTGWPERLLSSVAAAKAILAVIGPGWLDELRRRNLDEAGRWIPASRSPDWVRKELALSLALGKPFFPVLVAGAAMPVAAALPEDLGPLTFRQQYVLPDDDPARTTALRDLVTTLTGKLQRPSGPPRLWPRDETALRPDDAGDIYSSFGRRWDEKIERDSPHSYDYKFSVLDEETRHQFRVALLAGVEYGELAQAVTLSWLARLGEPRKFAHSETKRGLFLQASCIVTDGLDDGIPRQVLLSIRDGYQFHAPEQVRHIAGESCLVGTCLTSFDRHDAFGHLPTALLNSLASPNPWSLFSRKLLLPDPLIDCRFVGVGFNLNNQSREYVHLVWHVRTRSCPPMMLVPAREQKRHDVAVWKPLEEVARFEFDKALIDRLVLEQLLPVRFADGRTGPASPLAGFIPCRSFEQVQGNAGRPERWFRDTVVLDLLRLYQQAIHRAARPAPADADSLLADLAGFLTATAGERGFSLAVETRGDFLVLRLRDEERRAVYSFLATAALSAEEELTEDLIERYRDQLLAGVPGVVEEPRALFVLHGVRSDLRYKLQGAMTLLSGAAPIHVVKVALLPAREEGKRPVKEVTHAVLLVRGPSGEIGLLVTRAPKDELPRLPGGKVEPHETPTQALSRELMEELGLPENEIASSTALAPGGLYEEAVSPSSGETTRYRFYPFVVRVDDRGAARLRRLVKMDGWKCQVAPVTLESWRTTGLGFNPSYPEQVFHRLTPELMEDSIIDLPE